MGRASRHGRPWGPSSRSRGPRAHKGHSPNLPTATKVSRQQGNATRTRTSVNVALRDSWHRALVYFGLAEDHEHEHLDPEPTAGPAPETQLEDRYRERPNVRRLSSRRRRDEITGRPTAVLRPVAGRGNGRPEDVRVHLVVPRSFNDAQQVADRFKDAIPVILNLQGSETDLSKRLIDFASGLTYALDGGMQRIADKVFMLTPRNVQISAEERARLIEKGFFNQS
jgi:cell division inhibitor SepF